MNKLLTIAFTLFTFYFCSAQSSITVCHSPAAKKFYHFATTDTVYAALHTIPERTSFRSGKGRMQQIRTRDLKSIWVYQITPEAPSDKYVFLFHDEWGMTSNMKEKAEAIYSELENTNVWLIDFYASQKPRTYDQAQALLGRQTWVQTSNMIMSLLDEVGPNAEIVTMGYAVGGGWALEASMLAYKKSKGTVMYYGTPIMVQDILRNIQGPVLGIFSSTDPWITPDLVSSFQEKMDDESLTFMPMFWDATHGFATPGSPVYDEAAAADAQAQAMAFVKSQLRD